MNDSNEAKYILGMLINDEMKEFLECYETCSPVQYDVWAVNIEFDLTIE